MTERQNKLIIFQGKEIRRVWHEELGFYIGTIYPQIEMLGKSGKKRKVLAGKTEDIMAIRQNLTDEWKERGIEEQRDFAILTAEISKATFGVTPNEYKKLKQLPEKSKANLRDYMDDLELIFTMLG